MHTQATCAPSTLTKQGGCQQTQRCPDGTQSQLVWYTSSDGTSTDPHSSCANGSAPGTTQPTLTPGRIWQAFRDVPLPASPLKIQPPHGETLVNFDTIFYTTNSHPFARVIPNLLGHRIVFWIRPAEYDWYWGDGHWHTGTDPGRPYTTKEAIADDITHRYLQKDVFYPHLDTVYTANYKLDNGPWVPVPGSVTIEGDGVRLETFTAHPVLTDNPPGYDD